MTATGRHVVLGVSGGIASYKSCTLARRLTDTVNRLLPGLLHNPQAFVAFVAPHSQAQEDDDE